MTKPGKPTIDDALARRISDALTSSAGLAGDAELSAKLSSDKAAAGYAKDLSRLDKWLQTWPVREPSEEQFEALASRIEQRLKDLPTGSMLPYLAPPDFDDEDALRDATANLLTAGNAKAKVPGPKVMIPRPGGATTVGNPTAKAEAPRVAKPAPEAAAKSAKPDVAKPDVAKPAVAKPELAKADTAGKPEVAKADVAKADVASTPDAKPAKAERRDSTIPFGRPQPPTAPPIVVGDKPEAKAAPKPPAAEPASDALVSPEPSGEFQTISLVPEPPDAVAPVVEIPKAPKVAKVAKETPREEPPAPPPRALPKGAEVKKAKKPKDANDERISIPMPVPLAPVVQLDAARPAPAQEKKGGSNWGLLAAAAVVGLSVAVGGTLMLGRSTAPASVRGATAVGSVAPSERPPEPVAAAEVAEEPVFAAPAALAPAPPAVAPAPPATPMAAMPTTPSDSLEALAGYADEAEADDSDGRFARAEPATGMPTRERDDRARTLGGAGRRATADGESTRGLLGGEASAASAGGGAAGGSPGPGSRSGSGSGGGSATGASGAGSAATRTATVEEGRVAERPAPTGPLSETPSREAVRDALDGVAPQVYACYGEEEHGLAEVAVIVAGSGRVTTCTVSGRFAGTPVGSCIARAVRGARFPAFSQPRFEVHYEYRH